LEEKDVQFVELSSRIIREPGNRLDRSCAAPIHAAAYGRFLGSCVIIRAFERRVKPD
jgi:hypothetical protein